MNHCEFFDDNLKPVVKGQLLGKKNTPTRQEESHAIIGQGGIGMYAPRNIKKKARTGPSYFWESKRKRKKTIRHF